jgi:hypothetical protein
VPAHHKAAAAANPTTGPVGTTFTVNDSENNAVYRVTVLDVLQNAAPDNSFDAAKSGDHLVGVELKITGVSGSDTDDANNNTAVAGSNDQTYNSNIGGIAAGTNFNSGQYNVSAGESTIGWVNFQVPNGVTVASVVWTPDSGMGGSPAHWTVK